MMLGISKRGIAIRVPFESTAHGPRCGTSNTVQTGAACGLGRLKLPRGANRGRCAGQQERSGDVGVIDQR
jgi:hypothetical protein